MCGRIALFTPPAHLARFLDAALSAGLDAEGHPSWNVAPQDTLFGVSEHHKSRVMDEYRWGLIPSWAKDPSLGNRLFNARAEGITEKPSFRSAFARRPCVIPVNGFYEWDHRPGADRQPHFFARVDQDPVLLVGLYEFWRNPADPTSQPIATCTVITTTPGVDMEGIHDRMPVVLGREDVDTWLEVADHSPEERLLLLRPAAKGTLRHYGVGKAVGSVKNNGPELIEPAEPAEPQSLF